MSYDRKDDFQKDKFKIAVVNNFTMHLQTWRPNITVLEMVEIFGKDIAQSWQKIIIHTSTDVKLYDMTDEMDLDYLLTDYQKCYNFILELKEKLLKYASKEIQEEVKKRVKDHSDNPNNSKYRNQEYFKNKKNFSSYDKTQKDSE